MYAHVSCFVYWESAIGELLKSGLLYCALKDSESESVSCSVVSLCDLMDCSPSGSSVLGILWARILEWVAISSSRGSSWPKDWTWVSWIAGRFFTIWATRGAHLDSNQDSEFNIQILGEGFADHFLLFFLCIHHGLLEFFHQCTETGNRDYGMLY